MDKDPDLTQSSQDYLKAIYDLTVEGSTTSTTEVAEQLAVTSASVTNMVQKLASTDPPLVDYHKRHGVQLTPEGRQAALRVIRRHRLVESFLVQVLGYSWDEVHEDAERLEHVISPRLEARIAHVLGEPSFDPHGDPIPGADLSLPVTHSIGLNQLPTGKRATVTRVNTEDPEVLRYLAELGIQPPARLTVLSRIPVGHILRLQVGAAAEQTVTDELGALIEVELPNQDEDAPPSGG